MSNPNSQLWRNYEAFGRERGRLLVYILSNYLDLQVSCILDFGAGTGAIALECARAKAQVDALEPNAEKAAFLQQEATSQQLSVTLIESLPKHAKYDAIILLDVIEHLIEPETWLAKLYNALKPNGVIYLSTPNKFSPAHVLLDPHFSLPFLSLARRKTVKRIVADVLEWQPQQRQDFPELFSLSQLIQLFEQTDFDWKFINRDVVGYAVEHPQALWNRDLHLKIVHIIQKFGARSIKAFISDKYDVFNQWLNPTWYMILQKKARL